MVDKVRKIPAAFEGTRAIPAQYTTDPDIATPEQIASIGSATEKARKLAKGQRIVAAAIGGKPIATAPVFTNITINKQPSVKGQANRSTAGGVGIGINDPSITTRNRASSRIRPNFE